MVDAKKVVDDMICANDNTDEKPEELKKRMSRKLEEILSAKLLDE
jgi:polyhydroxyalkanoate synthesis regulator phasin